MEEFKKELETYKMHKERLLTEGHDQSYVLIREDNIIGIFKTAADAYSEGLKSFGNVPMFIKKISKEDPPSSAPAMYLGLLHANFQ